MIAISITTTASSSSSSDPVSSLPNAPLSVCVQESEQLDHFISDQGWPIPAGRGLVLVQLRPDLNNKQQRESEGSALSKIIS